MVEQAGSVMGRKGCWLSWPALALSLVALPLAAGGPWLAAELDPPPVPVEQLAADLAVRVRDRLQARLRGELPTTEPAARTVRWGRVLPKIALATGLAAVALAAVGLAVREDGRVAGLALGLGAAAVVLQWFVILAGVLAAGVVALLLLSVFASLGSAGAG